MFQCNVDVRKAVQKAYFCKAVDRFWRRLIIKLFSIYATRSKIKKDSNALTEIPIKKQL